MKDYSAAFTNTTGGAFPNTLGINATGPSATDGTEYVKLFIDDIWGARQDLMVEAGKTPSGNDEAVGSSDFVAALKSLFWFDNLITGLLPSNNGSDADHDIDVATGKAMDSTNAFLMKLTSGLIKQLDASWAVGTNAGGLFTGSVANDTWYHVFIIRKDSDGTIDAGFDTSVTAANIPGGYTAFRRIGSVVTDGSANILAFHVTETEGGGVDMDWDVYTVDFTGNIATSRVLRTLTVPTGIEVVAKIAASISGTVAAAQYWVKPTFITDSAPSTTNFDLKTAADNSTPVVFKLIKTDASGEIASRGTIATSHQILTQGFIDSRI